MQLLTSSAARDTYSVIITAPWEFLTDTDTVYPVTVDPTLMLYASSSSVIQDSNVFTNYNHNYGLATTMSIGDYSQYPGDTPRGTGYGLVKFPFLTGNSTFGGYYNAGRVTEVKYYFAVTDCVTQTTLQAKRISTAWTETGVTYSTVSSYISGTGTAYTKTINATSSPQYYSFDLLPMINTTTNYSNMATKGLVLSTSPTYMPALTIGTAEETSSSRRPYVRYTYIAMPTSEVNGIVNGTTYMIVNAATGKALSAANVTSQTTADKPYKTALFTVNYQSAGYYTIQKYAYDSDSFLTGESSLSLRVENGSTSQGWYLLPQENGTYQIHNAANENMTIYTGSSSTYVYFGNSNANNDWLLVPYILDVPLYKHKYDNTCGQACARMLLAGLDVSKTEDEIIEDCGGRFHPNKSDMSTLRDVINSYLASSTKSVDYEYIGSDETAVRNKIIEHINNGYPTILNIKANYQTYFPYETTGHYVVAFGCYYNSSGQWIFLVNDPHYDHYRTIHIPLSDLLVNYNMGSKWIFGGDLTNE